MDRDQAAIAAGHPEWASLPATRQGALDGDAFHYFTGKPCKHGHVAPRQRAGRGCAGCEQAFQQGDTARAAKLRYSRSDHGKSVIRKYHKEIWNGSPGDRADVRKYELRKLKAAPKWLTKEQLREIVSIYTEADRRVVATGVRHHVDHVVPLVAKHPVTRQHVACGLHVPWNLCVETAADNLTKGCYFDGWALLALAL